MRLAALLSLWPLPRMISLFKLTKKIDKRYQIQLAGLGLIMVFASLAEVVSIAAIIPLLGILSNPDKFIESKYGLWFKETSAILGSQDVAFFIIISFFISVLVAGMLRVGLAWLTTKVAFSIGSDLSLRIYKNTLCQPYLTHLNRNSSDIITGVTTKTDSVIYNSIYPVITIAGSFVLVLSILVALLLIDTQVAAIVFIGLGGSYVLAMLITKAKLTQIGKVIASYQGQRVKVIQEGLGGIRDVILDSSYSIYGDAFRKIDRPLRDAQRLSSFLAVVPRHGIETLALILFSSIAYWLTIENNESGTVISVLAATAMGAQRIMPAMQNAYHSWTFLMSGRETLNDVLALLENERSAWQLSEDNDLAIQFFNTIALKDIFFSYSATGPIVINGLSMEIGRGDRIGIIGTTGSGKSTLVDIIMGLLEPHSGDILIDGAPISGTNVKSWRRNISHVPQNIFLVDGSLKENIAFGIPSDLTDSSRVHWAAHHAQLDSMIEQLTMKYDSPVGERGISLSGGQRQRIGIARALYKRGSILVLDEATSALDGETESLVMNAIADLGNSVTVIVIAHRLTTLKFCNKIYEIAGGKISRVGSYDDIVGSIS